jgi:hypothetical protein
VFESHNEATTMQANVSDFSDPELDELEPVSKRKTNMENQGQEAEAKPVKVTGPINIKGSAYNAGDTVMLTDEEREAVTASGAPIEGVEPKSEEDIQKAHEESVEAQKKRIEDDKKAQDEAMGKEKRAEQERAEQESKQRSEDLAAS